MAANSYGITQSPSEPDEKYYQRVIDYAKRVQKKPFSGGNTGRYQNVITQANNDVRDYGGRIAKIQSDRAAQEEKASFDSRMDDIVNRADPFASQRGTYQTQLAELMNNPAGAMENNPFFKASNEQGMEAAKRRLAQSGMGTSGNAAIELQRTSQANMANQFMPMAQLLGGFSGANQNPAAGSGAMSDMLRLRESQRQFNAQDTRKPTQYSWQQPTTTADRGFGAYWGGGGGSASSSPQKPQSGFSIAPFDQELWDRYN